MTALAADKSRKLSFSSDDVRSFGVLTASTIYKGSAVGMRTTSTTGYVRALTGGASNPDTFVGYCVYNQVVNSGASGAKRVEVAVRGTLKGVAVTGASTVAHLNNAVYAADDDALTLTSTNNVLIGRTCQLNDDGTFDVVFEGAQERGQAS